MSAGLICSSVPIWLFLRLILTSEKFISWFNHSAVNLIVEWESLSFSINCFEESSPCFQMENISSIYLHHIRGYRSMTSKILSSISAINTFAYGGANLVPIAVALNCIKVVSLKWKILLFKTSSESSNQVSVATFFSIFACKSFLSEVRPSSCGILG